MKKNRIRIFVSISMFLGIFFAQNTALTNNDYAVYMAPPITNEKILPDSKPANWKVAETISIFAAPGEYEPVSLVISPRESLKNVKVKVEGLIPEIAIDVRLVKCWYQAGVRINDVKQKVLTPELLIHDDSIIQVDYKNKINLVGNREGIKDSPFLVPFDVPQDTLKQLWITIHVLENCSPGQYKARIQILPENGPGKEIKLGVEVLPVRLAPPILDYSIYYRGKLRQDPYPPQIGSEWKTEKHMEAELRDMKAHGIDNPTVYQRYDPLLLKQVIEIRKKAGIVGKPLLYLGQTTGAPQKPEELEALREKVRALVAFAKENGIPDVYIYGIDEAKGERLKAERLAFSAVHEAGGKVFVACRSDFADLVGDLLDLPIYSGIPSPSDIEKVHKFGHKIWNYNNPQCGVEEPLTYRRNYGLLLWQKGLDGTCDYAYQHAFGEIWDDFDHRIYRDLVMAYPTIDGVIPTIQWEGFREGVDDIRYLSTLIKAIEKAEAKGNLGDELNKAKSLLQEIKAKDLNSLSAEDFQKIRRRISEQITRLQ